MSIAVTAGLLVLSMVCANAEASGWPTKMWDLYAVLNGAFDNSQRSKDGNIKHDYIHIFVRTANVPALSQSPVLIAHLIENRRRVEACHVMVPFDGPKNDLVLRAYNFTGNYKFNPDTFDYNELANYSKDQFQSDSLCKAGLTRVNPGLFVGEWPVCTHKINGTYPAWGVTFICRQITATIPLFGDEVRNTFPYDMPLIGDKFPLIGTPDGYVNPCNPKNCASATQVKR